MRCIFCKEISDSSRSVEHIIPESLGNTQHILAKGIVCDRCNQYFARKLEKPILEYPYFEHLRHLGNIESKKGRIPSIKGIIGGEQVDIRKDKFGNRILNLEDPKKFEGIMSGKINMLIAPHFDDPPEQDKLISRFIAKVAIETLADRFYPHEGWNEEIVDKEELNELRHYARYGNKPPYWEYHQRRIYNDYDRFYNPDISDEPYEVLHEVDLLYVDQKELFLVLVIMGIEYVMSYTNPSITGYRKWLIENHQISPVDRRDNRTLVPGNPNDKWLGRKE